MPKYMRDILPDLEILRQDRRNNRYPTIARLGDKSRRGDNPVFFNDTNTVIYSANTFISLPTTFPVSSSYLSNDLKSSISVARGTVTKQGTDQYVTIPLQTESFRPFTEDRNIGVDTSDYYASGSDIFDVGLGFSNRLRDKTVLRVELPIKTSTRLVASGGYYYNFNTQTFDPISLVNVTIGNATGGIFTQSLLFNCLGVQQSRNYTVSLFSDFNGGLSKSAASLAWSYDSSYSLLLNGAYVATGAIKTSNFITTDKNFILEKATIDLPFAANSGWLTDSTTQYITARVGGPVGHFIGGPAVTVGLLNQIRTDRRDLIMSSTIVPAQDTQSWLHYMYVPSSAPAQGGIWRGLGGFTTWSTPGAVVSGSGASTFSGSVRLRMNSTIANGIVLFDTTITSINPFGRGMLDESGRSFFGKEFVVPQNISSATGSILYNLPLPSVPLNNNENSPSQHKVISLDQNAMSPYLLRDSDNLVIYIHTPTPSISGSVGSSPLTASYDISIPSGTMYLTMFGSEVADGVEFHDTLNQRLETNEIHECVGNVPVTDQFDTFYSAEYSGSIIDRLNVMSTVPYLSYGSSATKITAPTTTGLNPIYSNFSTANDSDKWSTQRMWSTTRSISELKKNIRAFTAFSDRELFWDTRVPDPIQVMKFQTPNFQFGGVQNSAPFTMTLICSTGPFNNQTSTLSCIGDWGMAYPYEGKFSGLTTKFSDKLIGDVATVATPSNGIISTFVKIENIQLSVGPSLSPRQYAGADPSPPLNSLTTGMSIPEFIKVFYGIGDGVSNVDNQFVDARGSTPMTGLSPGPYYYGSNIRGWRHGMRSGFPEYSKAVFRVSSYGQFRDMLEQRLDTKYIDTQSGVGQQSLLSSPVNVKFVDSQGNITLPEYTFSSNLSNEFTSSVPFVDGLVRNREEPITLARLNQNVVVI